MVTTSIDIPEEIYTEVRKRGMTLKGAFLMGWAALNERILLNERIRDLERELKEREQNIAKYQRALSKVMVND